MKHDSKVNKVIQHVGITLLLLAFVLTSVGAASAAQNQSKSVSEIAISKYLTAQQNPNLTDEDKIKAAIDAYFTTRYEEQKVLQAQDFSTMIEDNSLASVKKEKDKREIELYLASRFDLKYHSYKYTLDYDSLDIKDKKATIKLRESHQVIFNADTSQVSEMANLQHVFTLHSKNGLWLIYQDEYQDELSRGLNHLSKEDIKNQVDENYQDQLKRKAAFHGFGNKVLASPAARPLGLTAITYNRTAARNYAEAYWNNSTFSPYYRIDPSGNDCANYVAQSINAGLTNTSPPTAPTATAMGPAGTYPPGNANWSQQWYYKFNTHNGTTMALGYSASFAWINVSGQKNFIQTNNGTKKGPYGGVISTCSAAVGDIVQLQGVSQAGVWDHEGIIVMATASDPCSVSTYYVNSHTTARHNYPVSSWAVYPMRFVKISGGYK